ncbi:MAG: tRNA lysidine(34) synthetase TilS [Bacteroidales bacterium]|nr:tRNA lysidine(34) synthetase TilS [Bacteroidales bacterium]
MLKEFKSFVEKHNLISKDDRVLLALSGGVDSMVLAKLLLLSHRDTETPRHQGLVTEPVEVPTANGQQPTANIQQTLSTTQQLSNSAIQQLNLVTEPVEVPTANSQRPTANSQLSFAHCNFHLRGDDSDRDERFVTKFAKENNIPIYIKHFDTEAYAKENSLSIEMAARELRYAWFKELKEIHNFDKVALAHHGDDQIETFFINFLRGSGIKGLKGMKPQNDFYIRPLLWSNRNEIETFAKENDIQWVEDYTNQETVYLRNKIRHNIIPIFDEMKDNARQSLNFSIDCLSSENDLYRSLLEDKFASIEHVDGDCRSIDVKYFLENENGRQLLFEWVRRYGFNFNQAESMFEAMKNGKSGVMFYNDNGQQTTDNRLYPRLIASVQKDKIEIFEESEGDEEIIIESQNLKISESQKLKILKSQQLSNSATQQLRFSTYVKDADFKLIKDPKVAAQFDMDKIAFPLKLRHWKKGDRFKPLGMKGSKLLSDFFNDLGFSEYQKRNVWIMEDANDLILWVVGYRINDKVKILDSTKVIFQCDLES